MMHNLADMDRPVFDVNIVPPLETSKPVPQDKVSPEVREMEPVIVKKRRRPPEKRITRPQPDDSLKPETLFENGSGLPPQKDEDQKGLNSEKLKDSPSSDRKDSGQLPKEDGALMPAPFLFDSKTIEKYARKAPSPDKGLSFDTPGFKHRGYLRMLKERIESIWEYPKEAARRGISGDLYLVIIINRDGSLHNLELLRTSGFVDLDESAIKALKKAFPWAPLPEDYEGDTLKITGHFIYIHGSAYAM